MYGSKNVHQKEICSKESELHAQNLLIILKSIVNITRETLMNFQKVEKYFTMIIYKIFIRAPQIMRKMAATGMIWKPH